MKKHWNVETTSYRLPRDYTPLALVYDPTPGGKRDEEAKTTTYSLRFPALLMTELVSDGHDVANKIAEELNQAITLVTPRPISEYDEDMGDVLWWCWEKPIEHPYEKGRFSPGRWKGEPPYVGSPNDLGFEVLVETTLRTVMDEHPEPVGADDGKLRVHVGGWPGYHTHFTPLPPMPNPPKESK